MQPQQSQKLFQKLWHGADYNYEQWLDTPEILAGDFQLMRQAHCDIMSVGIFSWVMLEPEEGKYDFTWLDQLMDKLAENGISAALATPSAAPPAWLSHKYPETRRVNEQGIREPHQRRQNFCYTSPIYREKVTNLNTQLAERYQHHPALLLWHVSNEYVSIPCHCEYCYQAFHAWLKERYGDLDTLNRAWWATFWGHRYTDWEQIEPCDHSMHALMLDWQRFNSDQVLNFFQAESAPLRKITPEIPITTNFMRPDVGLNYWKFAEHLDIVSWDSYPRWHQTDDVTTAMQTAFYHDLHRSYKQGQPFLLIESSPSVTNWQGISRLKKPLAHKATSLQAVAHGSNSVQYFQWRQSRGGEEKFHGAVIGHLNSSNTRVYRDVVEVGKLLEAIPELAATTINAPVAIVYDFENEWALNLAQLPRSIGKNYQETCQQHYRTFWEHGISTDIISADADLSSYSIVVAPMLYMLRTGVAERIENFVKSGGIFITTYLSGMVNESDLCFTGGYPAAFRRTLGIHSEELDTLTDQQAGEMIALEENPLQLTDTYQLHHYAELVHSEQAQILAVYNSDFYKGYPALTMNAYGKGQAYYITSRTEDRFLRDFYGQIIKCAGLDNKLPLYVPAGVSVQIRDSKDCRFIFLINFSDQEQHVELDDDLQDAITNTQAERTIILQPFDMRILTQAKIVSSVNEASVS